MLATMTWIFADANPNERRDDDEKKKKENVNRGRSEKEINDVDV